MRLKKLSAIFGIIYTFSIASFFLFPYKTYAADQCPTKDGLINQNTTWTQKNMVNDKFDCSETDITIDGAILTLQIPSGLDHSTPFMNAKSMTFKNDGDIKITIKDKNIISRQIETVIEIISDPYAVGEIVAGAGIGLQILSIGSFLFLENVNIASILGVVSQSIFGSSYKKDLWGVVYNTKDIKPIPFAVIRLFDALSKHLISTTVTDLNGRYGFPVTAGTYYIEASHEDFVFPSKLETKTLAEHVYNGGVFSIQEDTSIDFNIPLDSKAVIVSPIKKVILFIRSNLRSFMRTSNSYFIMFMFILNLFLVIVHFNSINLSFTIIYFLIIFLKLISLARKPRTWGMVLNSSTNIPIPAAFVKLYKGDNRELVDTKITDQRGRFQFFIPKGQYIALVAATGYKFPSLKTDKAQLVFHDSMLKVEPTKGAVNINILVDPQTEDSVSTPFSN